MRILLLSSWLGAVPRYLDRGARIGFIPTAAEPYQDPLFIDEDRGRLTEFGYVVEEIDVSGQTPSALEAAIAAVDAIFMGGGNTFYLLQKLREKGVDRMVADHLARGKLYIGSSAGSVVMGPTIEPIKLFDEPADAPGLTDFRGLGHVNYVVLPHYGNPADMPLFDSIERDHGERLTFVKIRDNQAIFATTRAGFEVIESSLQMGE